MQVIVGPNQAPVAVPIATAQAVAIGDLVAIINGTMVRGQDVAWDTNLATTQAAFVNGFVGYSNCAKPANVARVVGHPKDNEVLVITDGVINLPCVPATYAVGDLVGLAKQTGNALESQKVVGVATEATAIGRCRSAGTGLTSIDVQLLSKLMPAARQS